MLRLSLVLLLFVVASSYALICPADNKALYGCSFSTVFILDVSSNMENDMNINTLFDYLETKILPRYGFNNGQNAGLASFGATDKPFMRTNDYNRACGEAEELRRDALTNGLQKVSLKDALASVYSVLGVGYDEPIILFSASNNATEISEAFDYVEETYGNAEITVVALHSNFSTWRNFQDISSYMVPISQIFNYQYLDLCILMHTCDKIEDYCSTNFIPTMDTYSPEPVTPTPGYTHLSEFQCQVKPQNVWSDVIFLFDSTYNIGRNGLNDSWNFARDAVQSMNPQIITSGQQRAFGLGLMTYGNITTMYGQLGEVDNAKFQSLTPAYHMEYGNNIIDAIQKSMDMFAKSKRSNWRKTIVIFGSVYKGANADLQNIAQKFRDTNGAIIVYDYKGELTPVLLNIAQIVVPHNDNGTLLQQAIASANCYCPNGTVNYFNNIDGTPGGACFTRNNQYANNPLASNTCNNKGGYLPVDDSGKKSNFLNWDVIDQSHYNWIDLKYDTTQNKYVWSSGKVLSDTDYQPWFTGAVFPPPTTQQCVAITLGVWYQMDCRQSLLYSCEIPPCDPSNFCPNQ